MSPLNQLYKGFPIKFFKTGHMLMKMRNTDNKDADRTIELKSENFDHCTISE